MADKKSFYITTTIPYVNAEPHIGFALEIIQADTMARAKRLQEVEVFFSTGSDEHGQKIFEAAQKAGQDTGEYVDHYAATFEKLKEALNLSNDNFIRTTDEDHKRAAQEMWKRCKDKGDIYEKEFEGLYCVGCERFLTERDIVEGKCSIHQTEPQLLKEKNWFFRLSKYEKQILGYLENPEAIIPSWRREEAIAFVKEGLEDFSISRDKSRLSWGVPVPDDDTQVMYVWFDALTNYISTLGWPNEGGNFNKFWEEGYTVQMAGKDQVRFQSIMWQGILFSAGIKNTDQVFYHGFINSGGTKMSKSLGNVISPFELVEKYGTDATRYLLLRHVHPTDDTDITWGRLDEWYEANLVNGLGNLVARVLTMAENYGVTTLSPIHFHRNNHDIDNLKFQEYMNHIWVLIQKTDKRIQDEEPYKKYKTDHQIAIDIVASLCTNLSEIAYLLEPVMPKTAQIIHDRLKDLKKPENLFPRLNA
jgi:methionyl-tRNA synthetase